MSTEQPKLVKLDPTAVAQQTSLRKILAEGVVQSQDSDYSCAVTNDTSTVYIVYLLHDNGWMAELWAQNPGQTMSIPPTWKLCIMTADGRDAVTGKTNGSQTYNACWSTTTQANSTFYFSRMSY